jgi:quercetin 2,3-dioxygenase
MLQRRLSADRGYFNYDWLETYHSFSFSNYYDPNYVQFGTLRVINEDKVSPNKGFSTHGHNDMEIVTYVLQGQLSHRDSMGNEEVIHTGEVQRMTAGTGITHSEYNASDRETVHLLQIWIKPNQLHLTPSYEQKSFVHLRQKTGQLHLIASMDKREESVLIHQDASISLAYLKAAQKMTIPLLSHRRYYLHLITGKLTVNGEHLASGDALMIDHETDLRLSALSSCEIMLFDLA